MTWWLTGLPAAGKSTLAQAIQRQLAQDGLAACVLDGDLIRRGLSSDLDFTPQGRTEQIRRTAEVAKLLNDQGIWVAVALVSPLRAARDMARTLIGAHRFIEVHVATRLEICAARDPKGLYAQARHDPALGLTGPQSAYEPPLQPDLILDAGVLSIQEASEQLIMAAANKLGNSVSRSME